MQTDTSSVFCSARNSEGSGEGTVDMKRSLYLLLSLLLVGQLLLHGAVAEAESGNAVHHAQVVSSEPIVSKTRNSQLAEHCKGARPKGASLSAVLQWDLGAGDCRTTVVTEHLQGYRVQYAWQGSVYSTVMQHQPGTTIPVRIRVN
jgi:uncharacterized protein YcfJ